MERAINVGTERIDLQSINVERGVPAAPMQHVEGGRGREPRRERVESGHTPTESVTREREHHASGSHGSSHGYSGVDAVAGAGSAGWTMGKVGLGAGGLLALLTLPIAAFYYYGLKGFAKLLFKGWDKIEGAAKKLVKKEKSHDDHESGHAPAHGHH